MTNLPFIGQLNTVFVVAIAFGMGLNILVMIQRINAVKSHDLKICYFPTTELGKGTGVHETACAVGAFAAAYKAA